MKIRILPKTRLGKWSAGFGAGFAFYFIVLSPIIMALSQQQTGEVAVLNQVTRSFLIAIGLAVMASGLLAFITALISLVKYKERAVLIYLAALIGLFAVVFLLGEFLVPH